MVDQFSEKGPREKGKLYPSEAGKCARQTFFKAMGFPGEPFSLRTRLKFFMGDVLEGAVISWMRLAGYDVTFANDKLPILIGGKERNGAFDGVLQLSADEARELTKGVNVFCKDDTVIFEAKSMTEASFRMFEREDEVDDTFGYATQQSVYQRTAKTSGIVKGPGGSIVLAVNTNTGMVAEKYSPYNKKQEKLAKAADVRFQVIDKAVEAGKAPPRPYDLVEAKNGRKKLGLACSYCSHRDTCWTEPRQIVKYEPKPNAPMFLPVYQKQPTQYIKIEEEKGRPVFYVETE